MSPCWGPSGRVLSRTRTREGLGSARAGQARQAGVTTGPFAVVSLRQANGPGHRRIAVALSLVAALRPVLSGCADSSPLCRAAPHVMPSVCALSFT